jgi:hypothetical protein
MRSGGFIPRIARRLLPCLLLATCWAAEAAEAPVNDQFTNSIVIVSTNAVLTGTTSFATKEPGEPAVPGETIGHSVWWTLTAPTNGQLTLSIPQSNYSSAVAVFAGGSLTNLQLVASNSSKWSGRLGSQEMRMRKTLSLDVIGGHSYQIAADWNHYRTVAELIGLYGSIDPAAFTNPPPVSPPETGGVLSIALSFIAGPANDSFFSPAVVTGVSGNLEASMVGAGVDDGEGTDLTHTVWWSWTAPHSGLFEFGFSNLTAKPAPVATTRLAAWPAPVFDPSGWPSAQVMLLRVPVVPDGSGSGSVLLGAGANFDDITSIRFFEDSIRGSTDINIDILDFGFLGLLPDYTPPPFKPVLSIFQGNSPEGLSLLNRTMDTNVSLRTIGGQTYLFSLASATTTAGVTNFQFLLTAPENDDFANRIALAGVEATASGHTVGATVEPGEPSPNASGSSNTAWWTWTPPVAGNATFTLTSTNFVMSVFKGDSADALQLTASSTSEIKLPVAANEPLQIVIDGLRANGEGDYGFSLKLDPLPPAIYPHLSHRLEDGSFLIRAEQLRGRKVSLFVSEDLVTWQELWTGVVNGDGVSFRDFGTIGQPSQFYSIKLAP